MNGNFLLSCFKKSTTHKVLLKNIKSDIGLYFESHYQFYQKDFFASENPRHQQ
jgi:hypothetical protein